VLYTVGSTGLTLMNSLIVADLTSLQNRGLFTSFLAVPWIINAYISGYMVDGLGVDGW
jgi:ABC-type sugar transport system permease subunit